MKKAFILLSLIITVTISGETQALNETSFETVWQTVNEAHYDPTFGGLDWREVYDRYKPQIVNAKGDSDFYSIVNKMLFELNLSHLLVASHDDLKIFLPTLFAEGSIGVDVRLFDRSAVITSVKPKSPGAQAGLRPGFVMQSINGITIENILANVEERVIPPFNSQNRRNNLTLLCLGHIYGPPDTTVSIVYRDGQGVRHKRSMKRKSRGRGIVFTDALPPFFIEFEAKRLEHNIGYIRFNHFAKPVDEQFINTLKSMRDTYGIIIDLRGNSGGYFRIVDTIAKHLLGKRTLFYTLRFRAKTIDKILEPVEGAYDGPVVVLIDVLSMSASEHFAACIQAINRAMIVGERTPGYLLVANWKKLPNGAAFMHTIAQPLTPEGTIIEENGVKPDIEVGLDHNALVRGIDTQLEEAVNHIRKHKK